jgi:hypothetical protein
MGAIVRFTPRTERGRGILDALENQTEARPIRTDQSGTREYWLTAATDGVDGYDARLDRIAPDWRDHLSR